MSDLYFESHIPPKQTVTPPQILDNLRHLFVISEKRKKSKTTKKKEIVYEKMSF